MKGFSNGGCRSAVVEAELDRWQKEAKERRRRLRDCCQWKEIKEEGCGGAGFDGKLNACNYGGRQFVALYSFFCFFSQLGM